MTVRILVLIATVSAATATHGDGQATATAIAPPSATIAGLPSPEQALESLSGDARTHAERALAGDRAAFTRLLVTPEAATFALGMLARDASADPAHVLLRHLRSFQHFLVHPSTAPVLLHLARTSPDAFTVQEAGRQYQAIRLQRVRAALERRIESDGGRDAAAEWLLRDHDRIVTLSNGAALPGFWREPPPIRAVGDQADAIRVLAFGDFGNEDAVRGHQRKVADAMVAYHRRAPFDLGITVGDNFYPAGLSTPDDERWRTLFDEPYGLLGVPIHATLGNHDWLDPDAPAAEIMRTSRAGMWRMPAQYYSFAAGPAQFFAIDTNDMSHRQLRWLKTELERSRARWKIVYGHFPPYMALRDITTPALVDHLMPILRDRADLYVAGHHPACNM